LTLRRLIFLYRRDKVKMGEKVEPKLPLVISAALFAVLLISGSGHAGSISNIYAFTGGADGGQLVGGVVQDAAGVLYGEAGNGGDLTCTVKGLPKAGCGTVYSYSAATGLKVLVTFTGSNGKFATGTPILLGTTLYGSTKYGGTANQGLIFSVNTDGSSFKVLHRFSGTDGIGPVQGKLVEGPGGALYGITPLGGTYGHGVLFGMKPSGSYEVLYNFTGGADGEGPLALLLAPGGVLVGSTAGGGNNSNPGCQPYGAGVIFTYTPGTRQFKSIADTVCGTTGPNPYLGSMGPSDTAYGFGGYDWFSVNVATGAVAIIPATPGGGGEAVGGDPQSGPIYMPDGSLTGTFSQGPYTAAGALYQVANGVVNDLWQFGAGPGGAVPYAQPLLTSTGTLIGTSTSGTCTNCGVIWQYTP
jgi:uncharacterized repeat protein (TIGR03803 family)